MLHVIVVWKYNVYPKYWLNNTRVIVSPDTRVHLPNYYKTEEHFKFLVPYPCFLKFATLIN